MDKNRDGVVTIEEFIETCQKVTFTASDTRRLYMLTKFIVIDKSRISANNNRSLVNHWLIKVLYIYTYSVTDLVKNTSWTVINLLNHVYTTACFFLINLTISHVIFYSK